jgi:hypothetical protein
VEVGEVATAVPALERHDQASPRWVGILVFLCRRQTTLESNLGVGIGPQQRMHPRRRFLAAKSQLAMIGAGDIRGTSAM